METNTVLVDAFERVRHAVQGAVADLTPAQLALCPDPDANSVAWLVWHLTRIQDDHIAGVAGIEQVWTARGWADRFGLPFPASATGYGHRVEEVAAVRVDSADLLLGYHEATLEQTKRYVTSLTPADLDRVVDEAWDPPVTLGVRIVSVIADDLQHAGQAAYVRGLIR